MMTSVGVRKDMHTANIQQFFVDGICRSVDTEAHWCSLHRCWCEIARTAMKFYSWKTSARYQRVLGLLRPLTRFGTCSSSTGYGRSAQVRDIRLHPAVTVASKRSILHDMQRVYSWKI